MEERKEMEKKKEKSVPNKGKNKCNVAECARIQCI